MTHPSERLQALSALYARRAPIYDLELLPVAPLRREAIAALALEPGQTVLDVGCGTGLSLPDLAQGVGPQGRIVAIEPCDAMMARARRRVAELQHAPRMHWIETPAESASLDTWLPPASADAALFFFTHDVLQQPQALAQAMRALKPGARVVAAGLVWASPWWPMSNLFVLGAAMHSIVCAERLDCPWHDLTPRLSAWEVERRWLESAYVLTGRR
ncbi:class I SAM-dependent methyltransferase [Roseateles amylovorans]|uniref:Methyltransferase domain-containing protein n=1 Tax=Roseateles amylovorans TaxID=2978473 RepID=A0ABY6AYI8_9BURK|nr:methyltransferase domain-containing protein [Roseateles amylovorans]UXH77860.1 methyltransferase domain-containing protein [Roseateles amylovorans]